MVGIRIEEGSHIRKKPTEFVTEHITNIVYLITNNLTTSTENPKLTAMPKQHFFYKKDGLLKKLNLDEVIFLEASKNYTKFHTLNSQHLVRITLDAAMNVLPANKFLRIHRSFAVSADHIDEMGRETVRFASIPDLELPVSRKYFADFAGQVIILDPVSMDESDDED
jgi:DNA-binding LytR/AlgR family response regulator